MMVCASAICVLRPAVWITQAGLPSFVARRMAASTDATLVTSHITDSQKIPSPESESVADASAASLTSQMSAL